MAEASHRSGSSEELLAARGLRARLDGAIMWRSDVMRSVKRALFPGSGAVEGHADVDLAAARLVCPAASWRAHVAKAAPRRRFVELQRNISVGGGRLTTATGAHSLYERGHLGESVNLGTGQTHEDANKEESTDNAIALKLR